MAAHRGEAHHLAKLTEDDVREMRKLHAEGVSFFRIAERYGWLISTSAVGHAVRGRSWRHVQ